MFRTKKLPINVRLQRVRNELRLESVLKECISGLKTWHSVPRKVLCLGLGSPTNSVNAQAQLALLLEICDSLAIDYAQISAYDPVFTDEDRTLFTELDLTVLSTSNYVADAPTLLYMPHCDLDLYETILRAHWSETLLSQILLVCNHFQDYVDNNSERKLKAKAPCLLRIVPFLKSEPLPSSSAFPTAFNNTSFQFLASKPPESCFEATVDNTGSH